MERRTNSSKSRTRLSSVANSLRLIKAFSEDEYEIGISDLAKRPGLAKSTVHRLASTLLQEGMLEQNSGDGKYHLGLALFELGALVRSKIHAISPLDGNGGSVYSAHTASALRQGSPGKSSSPED